MHTSPKPPYTTVIHPHTHTSHTPYHSPPSSHLHSRSPPLSVQASEDCSPVLRPGQLPPVRGQEAAGKDQDEARTAEPGHLLGTDNFTDKKTHYHAVVAGDCYIESWRNAEVYPTRHAASHVSWLRIRCQARAKKTQRSYRAPSERDWNPSVKTGTGEKTAWPAIESCSFSAARSAPSRTCTYACWVRSN